MERMTNDRQFPPSFVARILSFKCSSHIPPKKKKGNNVITHPIEKEHHLNQPIFGFQAVHCPGCFGLHLFSVLSRSSPRTSFFIWSSLPAFWRVSNCQVHGISGHVVYLDLLRCLEKNLFSGGVWWRLAFDFGRIHQESPTKQTQVYSSSSWRNIYKV